jgi:hypothetical protein
VQRGTETRRSWATIAEEDSIMFDKEEKQNRDEYDEKIRLDIVNKHMQKVTEIEKKLKIEAINRKLVELEEHCDQIIGEINDNCHIMKTKIENGQCYENERTKHNDLVNRDIEADRNRMQYVMYKYNLNKLLPVVL